MIAKNFRVCPARSCKAHACISQRSIVFIANIDPFMNQVDAAIGCIALETQLGMGGQETRQGRRQ